MLAKSDKNRHFCHVPILGGKHPVFLALRLIITMGFLYSSLNKFEKVPFYSCLLSYFF